jgi:hypothetical protein
LPDDAVELHERIAVWHDEQAQNFAQFKQATDPSFRAELGWPVRA